MQSIGQKAHLPFLKLDRYGVDLAMVIIGILGSVSPFPKVITLSGFHFTWSWKTLSCHQTLVVPPIAVALFPEGAVKVALKIAIWF